MINGISNYSVLEAISWFSVGCGAKYELSIFELERGGQWLYQYILRSPDLAVSF